MAVSPEKFGMDEETFNEIAANAKASADEFKDPTTAINLVELPDISLVKLGETPSEAHVRIQREQREK